MLDIALLYLNNILITPPVGLEPTTCRLTAGRSTKLSYGGSLKQDTFLYKNFNSKTSYSTNQSNVTYKALIS